ncbi:MAG: malate permease, partial [Parafilimonas terrae]|nr:malate permease [Parafilimonas terrae]
MTSTATPTPIPSGAETHIAERPAARFWPERWWRLVDFKIGIIPLPIYVILAALIVILVQEGEIKPDAPTMIAVL